MSSIIEEIEKILDDNTRSLGTKLGYIQEKYDIRRKGEFPFDLMPTAELEIKPAGLVGRRIKVEEQATVKKYDCEVLQQEGDILYVLKDNKKIKKLDITKDDITVLD